MSYYVKGSTGCEVYAMVLKGGWGMFEHGSFALGKRYVHHMVHICSGRKSQFTADLVSNWNSSRISIFVGYGLT